jgi:hypothetical protein
MARHKNDVDELRRLPSNWEVVSRRNTDLYAAHAVETAAVAVVAEVSRLVACPQAVEILYGSLELPMTW